jgi:hypothetical protein
MEELINKLNSIPNSYFGFVAGIVTYVKQKPSRLDSLLAFINGSDNLTPSDIVKFVMDQPDFHEYGLALNERVG